jgi:ubiquinone/menaquinone biosynthesis C-methylase UbiE
MDNNTVYEWILHTTFAVANRAKSLACLEPYLSPLVRPGDAALDLCCGSGPMSFWFADRGAKVTAIDFAPYMIALAREEATRRNAPVEFIEADIFKHDLGQGRYDLVSCFGNSISDFPLYDYAKLVKRVAQASKPGGRFVLQYHDGSSDYITGKAAPAGVYQETPERITFRFQGYDPEIGAVVKTIRNETRGEEYPRRGYIYTVPVVQLITGSVLELEQHILLEENHYLDIFTRSASTT